MALGSTALPCTKLVVQQQNSGAAAATCLHLAAVAVCCSWTIVLFCFSLVNRPHPGWSSAALTTRGTGIQLAHCCLQASQLLLQVPQLVLLLQHQP